MRLAALVALVALLGCAAIERRPAQRPEDFCAEYALMRPSVPEHSFRYWYVECLRREYARP